RGLALASGQRRLHGGVPGAEAPAPDEAVVRATIVHLIRRFYGETVAADSPQVGNWFLLYRSLYNDSTQGGTGEDQVPGTQGERAWRGLLTAMLRSPRIVLY